MSAEVADALQRVVGSLPGGGEVRTGQRTMAEAVARALREERHLVVQAGTGTGKSLGYLVPAICSGKRVVVATATKALQDQLGEKDLPLLQASLRRQLRFAVLKGRANYLCRQRLAEAKAAGDAPALPGTAADARAGAVRAVFSWAERTKTGDRAELAEEPEPALWSTLSVTAEECPGATRCPAGEECFAEAARGRAAAADVVIINLHLLGADVAAGGSLLPEHDALVVDEAHALEDVMSESLGRSLGAGRLRALAAAARAVLGAGPERRRAEAPIDGLFAAAERLEALLAPRRDERLRVGREPEIEELLALLGARAVDLEAILRRSEAARRAEAGAGGEEAARLARLLLLVGGLREDLGRLAEPGADEVVWISGGARPAITMAPIDVAPHLAAAVFSKRPVVLASATIPAGLGRRLGADPERTDEIDVGSPFDYATHGVLYCAAHLPDRRRPESEPAVAEEICALIEAAGGRTLALFTSREAMARAAQAARTRVAHPVLVQGEGGKQALLARFAAEPDACLFATMGFWQGVDVAGETLSCVVIDRIPFPRPDDPLLTARRERAGRDAFRVIDLPRAASLLAQGAGRLIRSASDRGVVAVLDSRLANAPYRWDLVRALPPMRRTRQRADAEAFLRSLRAGAGQ